MTGLEIQAQANLHTEHDVIDDISALKFINEWLLMDLGNDAGMVDSESIVVTTANEWKALPVDFVEELEITKDAQPYWGSFYNGQYNGSYDLRNGQIRFPYAGTYVIWHIRRPAAIAALTDTPEVNAVFHYCGSLYVAYRFKFYDDESSKDAQRLRTEYDFYRGKAINEFKLMSKTTTRATRTVKAKAWR